MGKTLKYVSEFSFPSDKGYSGSAGQQMVKGYARGGSCGYAKGGMAKAEGGKMDRLKGVIGNERKEMTRVEAKQRDAGQELSRVRSEMRYDKNEMKGMRKQYPVDRREPMIAMAPAAPAMAKGGMLFSKKEVNAKNLLGEGKAPPLPHAKGSVNMAKGGMTAKQQGKVGKVMGEFKAGELHSGSKSGPVVKSRKQAIAIGMSEARKAKK